MTATATRGGRRRRLGVDTTCAIVGGVVAAHVGAQGLPGHWRATCEPLPDWAETVCVPAGRTGDR
ncbi:hypothetical protein [Pseudofrankia asymbiotica]|uniref:ADP-ribosylglycohydrolase n=1 Tax=Pseudofrankia asymbiotica TaxID=1834516 RepID=A0A1V2I4I7_9ACTN|nr:hypothetical protein [Pseudofrankia asymbiotica]ONH25631.1 hypothetical protein BL253_26835 [Pseudofrankia asymbiotica]